MSDLQTLLEYNYEDELEDYAEHAREAGTDLGPTRDAAAWEAAAVEDHTHIFGSIVRIGRQHCGWK